MKTICVIDGQGGGIGSVIIRKVTQAFGDSIDIVALGTNAIATAQMLKARANRGATGENAIRRTVPTVDVVIGSIGIVLANAMLGEVTPAIAAAVASSPAPKLLLPLTEENVTVAGSSPLPLPKLMDELIETHLRPLIDGRA